MGEEKTSHARYFLAVVPNYAEDSIIGEAPRNLEKNLGRLPPARRVWQNGRGTDIARTILFGGRAKLRGGQENRTSTS